MKPILTFLSALLYVKLALAGTSGDLKQEFNNGGTALFTPSYYDDQFQKTLALPDGKMLLLSTKGESGPMAYTGYIARMNADGSIDQTFGYGGGTTFISASQIESTLPRYMALAPGGKIVVYGMITSANMDLFVAQLNSDGTLDTTFNGNGLLVIYNATLVTEIAAGLVVQSDGKIVIAENGSDNAGSALLLSRINSNGTFDFQYGSFGSIMLAENNRNYNVVELVNDEINGRVVAIGGSADATTNDEYPFIAAFNNNGPDSSFAFNGINRINTTHSGFHATSAIWKNNNGFAVAFANIFTGNSYLYHFTPLGLVDNNYATTFPCPGTVVLTMAQQSNGQIVYGGHQLIDASRSLVLVGRLQYNGSVDSSFARTGYVTYSLYGDSIGSVRGLQLLQDGTILGATDYDNTTYGTDFIVFELLGQNVPDLRFNTFSSGFGNVPVGSYSGAQNFSVHGEWLPAYVTVYAGNGFQISKDGNSWSQSFTLTPSDFELAPTGDVVFKTRFAPQATGMVNSVIWSVCNTLPAQWNDTILLSGTGVLPNGISETELNAVTVFPNPLQASSVLQIEVELPGDVTIQVVNTNGQMVYEWVQANVTPGKHTIGLPFFESFANGVYYIKLNTAYSVATRKVIKQ